MIISVLPCPNHFAPQKLDGPRKVWIYGQMYYIIWITECPFLIFYDMYVYIYISRSHFGSRTRNDGGPRCPLQSILLDTRQRGPLAPRGPRPASAQRSGQCFSTIDGSTEVSGPLGFGVNPWWKPKTLWFLRLSCRSIGLWWAHTIFISLLVLSILVWHLRSGE